MRDLATLFLLVVALNAIPTAIPTAAVVSAFSVRAGVSPVAAVAVGAAAATCGRALLALGVRYGVAALARGAVEANVRYVERRLAGRRHVLLTLAGIAALPVTPATAIFSAAGALRLRIAPILAGYLGGRLVTFAAWVYLARGAADSVSALIDRQWSPVAVAAAVLLPAVGLVAALRLDWRALLEERRLRFLPIGRA